MLDLKFIRENPELVKENIKKKFQDEKIKLVDDILKNDEKLRKLMNESQKLRSLRNNLSKEVALAKKAGKDVKKLMKEAKEVPAMIEEIEKKQNKLKTKITEALLTIPNIIHESVPIGKNDKENVEVEKVGQPKDFDFKVKNHAELAEELNIADFDAASRVAGNGFFYLKGDLARLNQAIIQFGTNFMLERGFTLVEPPLMLNKDAIHTVMPFEDFKEHAYKIDGQEQYLIATSEHPLVAMFKDQVVDKKQLPIKIAGISQCFRQEIGSHGIDEKGLFRTHQFNKVEQVIVCEPEDSYRFYDEILNNCKELFKALGLPVRVLECCSGDLADLKSKSADLEVYSPRKKEYFEVCSCSNLTDAQARRANIKVYDGEKRYVPHTLNNTAIATSRAMVAILENYQNKDGSVTIPKVLRPYMNGQKVIEKNGEN